MNKIITILLCSFFVLCCSSQNQVLSDTSAQQITANNDQVHTTAGQPVSIDVLANDINATGDGLSITHFSKPRHGSVALKGSRFVYSSSNDFSGTDYFFYSISNKNGDSATAHVKILVIRSIQPKTELKLDDTSQNRNVAASLSPQQPASLTLPPPSDAYTTSKLGSQAEQPAIKAKQSYQAASKSVAEDIQNPYYPRTLWKLWFEDAEAVDGHKVIEPFHRVFPVKPFKGASTFLNYATSKKPKKQYYAGFWDDFYLNQDKNHSHLASTWDDGKGNKISKIPDKIMHASTGYYDASNIKNWGVNFTSQSTTGMGHAITNRLVRMRETEVFYYFSDAIRCGPAHASYNDKDKAASGDLFHALTPIMLNSYGASGSEMNAISKMLLAGGYLPKNTKQKLKRNGLYPSALLYIWKAALPYQVPYANELRHRVAYLTNPNSVHGWYKADNLYHLKYDEVQHLRNMLEMAKNMTVAPPIAILKKIDIEGGEVIYDQLKSTWLIRQNKETVTLTVSTEDAFDLQGLPLSYQWTVLYGNKKSTIIPVNNTEYTITVPYDPKLPKGRTAIMLTVNNGHYDSNPAIINIYRNTGKNNQRPTLNGLYDAVISPGETIEFTIESVDPEGFPTTLYQWANEIGSLSGKHFSWTAPLDAAAGKHAVTLISSDGSNGSSYQSKQITIEVKP